MRFRTLLLPIGVLLHTVAFAQEAPKCDEIGFQKPERYTPLIAVDRLEGLAAITIPEPPYPLAKVRNVCIVLFEVRDRKRVSVGVSDEAGRFVLSDPKPGAYVLIASTPKLKALVVPIRVPNAKSAPGHQRGLLLNLRMLEDSHMSSVSVIANGGLRHELLEMARVDQAVRNELIRKGALQPDPEVERRMAALDLRNTQGVLAIVDQYGWPKPQLVGPDGVEAVLLIVQHAAYEAQKKLFPLIEQAYRAGNVTGDAYALLSDRILVREGKPQMYGTQAKPIDQWIGGEAAAYPIDDEAHVDARRAQVGLPPLAVYLSQMKGLYFPKK